MTSVINQRKSVVNCAENRVLEVLEDLRLDLKFVQTLSRVLSFHNRTNHHTASLPSRP